MRLITNISKVEITDFEKEVGKELLIRAHHKECITYIARFDKCDICEGGCLISVAGYGYTIDEALIDYCKQIKGKRLCLDSYSENRRYIEAPLNLQHTKKVHGIYTNIS